MTWRIFAKLLLTVIGLMAVTGLGAEYLVSRIMSESLRADLEKSLVQQTKLARELLENVPREQYPEVVARIARDLGARVTAVEDGGTVIADSDADAGTMENHASRPEFQRALAGAEGLSSRRSGTVGVELLYCAVPMREGAVRVALPLSEIDARVTEVQSRILGVLLLALAPAVMVAGLLSRRVSSRLSHIISYSQKLAAGDFQAQAPNVGAGELGTLAGTLENTAGQLRSTFEQLQDERSRFAAAVNGIGEGILVVNRKMELVLYNPAMEQMLPDARLAMGASLLDWPRREIPELFSKVLEGGDACSVDVKIHDPVERSWKVSCAPITSRKGKVQAVVAVFYDITELERVDHMRRDFVINVSHELRTPLAAIQGYAETLLDGAIDDPGVNRRFMMILWQNAERLAQLTADLMTLSQIEVNTREFHFSPHRVRDLLDQAADSIRKIAEKKSIAVSVDPTPADLTVQCDSGAIHQVLSNLLDNAAKYTPEGGAIRLSAAAKGERVEFAVLDTGIGIPAEHVPRLFERFYRVDKARSRELGGTGLGLAIVKHLVLAHHGAVRVESQPGKGSAFYFEIPTVQKLEWEFDRLEEISQRTLF